MSVCLSSLKPGDKFTGGRDPREYTVDGPLAGTSGLYKVWQRESEQFSKAHFLLGSTRVDPVKDTRECGWMGCGKPECSDLCAGVPADDHAKVMEGIRRSIAAMEKASKALEGMSEFLRELNGPPKRDDRLTVAKVNDLLDVNLWETVKGFSADVRIDFDEYGRVMAVELLDKEPMA